MISCAITRWPEEPASHRDRTAAASLGVFLRLMGPQATRETIVASARAAENAGLDDLWVPDHIAIPPDDAEGSDGRYLDALTSLAYLAASTRRIGLGTAVLVLPYRAALQTAKAIATLQELSGGRLRLGVGVGFGDDLPRIQIAQTTENGSRDEHRLAVHQDLEGIHGAARLPAGRAGTWPRCARIAGPSGRHLRGRDRGGYGGLIRLELDPSLALRRDGHNRLSRSWMTASNAHRQKNESQAK